ncbi:hypothetical protein K443DRAFT_28039, partial [Laccaria amethystina LaAM-08-1]
SHPYLVQLSPELKDMLTYKTTVNMTDFLQFENLLINVFGMHIGFIILQVSAIMEVPLLRLQIGPCLK